jgi:TRAP-type C4-dicarboxylate transport system substrate-binding protein
MRKSFWFALLVALAVSASPAIAAEPIKIGVTVQFPVTEPFVGATVARFKAAVEKESNNELEIEIFDRSRRYIDDQVIGAIRTGEIEMGLSATNQISRLIPGASLLEQPFLFNYKGLMQAAAGRESEMRKLIDDAVLEKFGLRVLWWQTIGRQIIFGNIDVRDPSAIKGKKVRTYSKATASLVKHCGGQPTVASASVVNKGLKEGTYDMAMMSAASAQNWKLFAVTDVITRTEHAAIAFLAIISEKVWQSLQEKHRAIIIDVSKRVEDIARNQESELEAAAYELHKSKGVKIYDLSPEDFMAWRACSAQTIDEYMEEGGEFSRLLMDAYGRLRTAPCCRDGPPLLR